ncbi:RNA-binding transcriptional accessory protein [Wenzhouxiangella sp. AB-CW3]|uniref:Tex family protein n=1 Tax=Wenzhouxiangella sp. AB-CW3 TaxID=2771012 RepID=UPI00168B9ACC|nr:Tex family protein [Wenzhouxiangella sp. AB-CW3]QOC22136.1 RNA-binding transcriptional accessory protein [Wenzhouxiangella sp. AB-CW3]
MTEAVQAAIARQISVDVSAPPGQVSAAIELLDGGATVPFIARYRKEATGGLDDAQLRLLEQRLGYLRELEDRRATVLASIDEQGKLSDELRADIEAADTKARLEDLYLPYKPKRRTRAQIAREAGLEPLLDALLEDPGRQPQDAAEAYVDSDKGVADAQAALDGARQILIERAGEHADLIGGLREWLHKVGRIHAQLVAGKENEGAKYRDYFDHVEPISKIASHRLLALFRARNEGILTLDLEPGDPPEEGHDRAIGRVAAALGIDPGARPADDWLATGVRLAWKARLHTSLSVDLFMQAREKAEEEAIRVFSDNLGDLLLAAPAGPKVVMGLDPALRTGVKVAVVDGTGKLLDTATVYPHAPQKRRAEALTVLAELCRRHAVEFIAIGNGTASRETDQLASELVRALPGRKPQKLIISEAGASVYSASELASRELPDLDVSLRGAVSIARRLQDPLAELVKIDPKSIGVGQYQHDVDQGRLGRALDARVEDCVNAVGVHVNTASAALLSRVAGISATVAANIVAWRDEHGAFRNRRQLLKVPRLGEKAFEQSAGFLRIADGDHPLDASAVHPEAYALVERMLETLEKPVTEVIGKRDLIGRIRAADFVDQRFGLPTIRDILAELEKPGRDPRPEFRTARLADDVETLADLKPGMVLEGTVSNVAAFGAFVDLGVHQDGLVHISAMSRKFIKDPREVVRAGAVVQVKVLEVDLQRKRIALTLRLDDPLPGDDKPADAKPAGGKQKPSPSGNRRQKEKPAARGSLADAFERAKRS